MRPILMYVHVSVFSVFMIFLSEIDETITKITRNLMSTTADGVSRKKCQRNADKSIIIGVFIKNHSAKQSTL